MMNYIIITLLLIIILLNFKNKHNKKQVKNKHNEKQVKNKHNEKQVKNKLIIGGYGVLELSNLLILFITLTIIMYFTYISFSHQLHGLQWHEVVAVICGISFVISSIGVLTGMFSYNIIKGLIIISIILTLFSTLTDVSTNASFRTGCSVEPLIFGENSLVISEEGGQNIAQENENSNTSSKLGDQFKYTKSEWDDIVNPKPENRYVNCMNLHNRSYTALKQTGILGRFNYQLYSTSSWVGYLLNYFIVYIVFLALHVNEKTNTLSRLKY